MSGDPETVSCTTCGATARRITWGSTDTTCYRCTECHAGGHIVYTDGGRELRRGGVFRRLSNYATRRVTA
ncbi:hypothetical protein NP511_04770 [Natrinema thermotolerans]|uniref:Uncharacterized protein n=1 Tax=Natrinema thermotolerans TaxID=121872 RepID=A0AAF0PGR4_9EURY|nr:hypothetical protein [Natrinema thermotolerans]QCC57854.1 hypothetical protein DVR14_04040 [Natrinema thermotolerans]WMT08945.1 hypothetical protein NP511_04770 [Natrinema thermotolerans]